MSMRSAVLVAGMLLGLAAGTWISPAGGTVPQRVYVTERTDAPPRIDGAIDDRAWDTVPWSGEFVQQEPSEGAPPSYPTQFKILYDDRNLYIAYRAYDSEPDRISSILARRDYFPGDWVEINIDSLHDHRTGFSFTASVSGTQGDEFISEDGNNWDSSWDPVWEHKARIDGEGWTAEVRIPLSQLRYADRDEHVWGIQVQRRLYRKEERSTWQSVPREESGWVSRFGELRGIRGIHPQRRIELVPYAVLQGERFKREPGNPFADGSEGRISGGLDGKIGVTGDLTMDLTVNPDFGQVEADPSQVNLTAFETFFQEKRPFFIEGSNILNLRVAPSIAYGTHTSDRLFYSRRIGRPPHYAADAVESGFVDQPQNTSIAGAVKLTGKSAKGYSIGLLECVTDRERAVVESEDGHRRRVTVEPRTNFFVGRLQRDWNRGGTRIGGMLTAVHRDIDDDEVRSLHDEAFTGGVDLFHYLVGRNYYLAVHCLGSNVRGDRTAILATQTAPARYYQRPDNRGQSVDSTRTSLSGHGGSVRAGRSEGKLRFETGMAWRSPGFELNDIGYLRTTDEINQFSWVGYDLRKPFSVFREMGLNANQWLDFEYGGENLYQALNFNTNARMKNNWGYEASFSRQNERISNYELRGGPSMRIPGDVNGELSIFTDENRRLSMGAGAGFTRSDDDAGRSRGIEGRVTWMPDNAVRVQVVPSYDHDEPSMQYIETASFDGVPRHIFGSLDQKTLSLSLRLDFSITPKLTVQYYGSPFVSAGQFDGFRRISRPRAAVYADRSVPLDGAFLHREASGVYEVDEDRNGSIDYAFGDPDFNVRDFHSNLVIRWEYTPGSSIFLVWSQSREGYVADGRFSAGNDLEGLFDVYPDSVFLLKVNRWFSL